MKRKVIIILLGVLTFGCGLNNLEDRVDRLEDITTSIEATLGHDSPMYINYSVTNTPEGASTHTDVYNFNGYTTNAIQYDFNQADSIFIIQLEKSNSIALEERAFISFSYEAKTKSFNNITLIINLIDNKGNYRNHQLNTFNAQFTINVKELNLEKGFLDMEVSSYFIYNQLENCSFKFLYRGKLKVINTQLNF